MRLMIKNNKRQQNTFNNKNKKIIKPKEQQQFHGAL